MQIRPADVNEAEQLTQLAIRSKAHWGYSETFMQAAMRDLTVTAEQLHEEMAFVAEQEGDIVGFYKLRRVTLAQVELTDLFIEPGAMGQGWGRALWDHAVATARAEGYVEMVWESDPFAEGFYLRMGATRFGVVESSVLPGRVLPHMRYLL
jgi:GNAT superfamily N-acetyltransferase